MHADALYHRMLDQEAAAADAKAQGLPAPSFGPLVPLSDQTTLQQQQHTTSTGAPVSASAAATLESARPVSYEQGIDAYLRRLKPEVRQGLHAEWEQKKYSDEEKLLAARAYAMEAEAGVDTANHVAHLMEQVQRGREQRRKDGTASVGDYVSGWLGR